MVGCAPGSPTTSLCCRPTDPKSPRPGAALQPANNLSDLANTGTARTNLGLGLGTGATLDAGTAALNLVQLDGSARLPAVDGSHLTGIAGGGVAHNNMQPFLAVNWIIKT